MLFPIVLALLPADVPQLPGAGTSRAVWLADLAPATVKSGTVGRWVFVPGSRADDVTGVWQVEAAGAGDVVLSCRSPPARRTRDSTWPCRSSSRASWW